MVEESARSSSTSSRNSCCNWRSDVRPTCWASSTTMATIPAANGACPTPAVTPAARQADLTPAIIARRHRPAPEAGRATSRRRIRRMDEHLAVIAAKERRSWPHRHRRCRPRALVLLGLPAQHQHPRAGGLARDGRHRLPLHGERGWAEHGLHADGRRRRALVGQAPFTRRPTCSPTWRRHLLPLRPAGGPPGIAARVNITYKILYNDAVAMTGGQPVDGTLSVAAMTQVELGGRGAIVVVTDEPDKCSSGVDAGPGVTVRHRDELTRIQREAPAVQRAPSLVYDQTCATGSAAAASAARRTDPIINDPRVCGLRRLLGAEQLPRSEPVETEFGRKRTSTRTPATRIFLREGLLPELRHRRGGSSEEGARRPLDPPSAPRRDPRPALPWPSAPWASWWPASAAPAGHHRPAAGHGCAPGGQGRGARTWPAWRRRRRHLEPHPDRQPARGNTPPVDTAGEADLIIAATRSWRPGRVAGADAARGCTYGAEPHATPTAGGFVVNPDWMCSTPAAAAAAAWRRGGPRAAGPSMPTPGGGAVAGRLDLRQPAVHAGLCLAAAAGAPSRRRCAGHRAQRHA